MVQTYSLEQAEEGIPEHGECAFPGCSHDVIVGRDTVLSGVLARALRTFGIAAHPAQQTLAA